MGRKSKTAERLERELRRDRDALSDTLSALTRDIPLDRWISAAAGMLGGSSGDITRNLGTAMRRNPGTTALAGAGLAVTAYAAARMLSSKDDAPLDREPGFEERLRAAEEALREEATGLWEEGLEEPASDAAASIRDYMADVMDGFDAEAARDRVTETAEAAADSVKRNPLAYGAGAAALGALAAALLSRSETEEMRLRRRREALLDEAREIYEMERRRLAAAARAAAADAAGHTRSAAHKVGRAARSGYSNGRS